MKQHLSHRPHQWSSRCAGSWWKARLQLRKAWWYCVRRANCCETHSSLRGRRYENTAMPGPSVDRTRSPKARSNSSPLDHWWFTARPSATTVGTEADHSLDSTTASRRSRTAATRAAAVMIAVTGTWPLRNPSSAERRTSGSMVRVTRVTGSPDTAAASSMAVKRSPGGSTTNNAASGWSAASASTVTIESMPPPKGIRGRPGTGS